MLGGHIRATRGHGETAHYGKSYSDWLRAGLNGAQCADRGISNVSLCIKTIIVALVSHECCIGVLTVSRLSFIRVRGKVRYPLSFTGLLHSPPLLPGRILWALHHMRDVLFIPSHNVCACERTTRQMQTRKHGAISGSPSLALGMYNQHVSFLLRWCAAWLCPTTAYRLPWRACM